MVDDQSPDTKAPEKEETKRWAISCSYMIPNSMNLIITGATPEEAQANLLDHFGHQLKDLEVDHIERYVLDDAVIEMDQAKLNLVPSDTKLN